MTHAMTRSMVLAFHAMPATCVRVWAYEGFLVLLATGPSVALALQLDSSAYAHTHYCSTALRPCWGQAAYPVPFHLGKGHPPAAQACKHASSVS